MIRETLVTTGARLHFGLYAFGPKVSRQFGGVGAMVDVPLVLRLTSRLVDRSPDNQQPPPVVEAQGPMAARAREFALTWLRSFEQAAENDWIESQGVSQASGFPQTLALQSLSIQVLQSPAEHVGLGLGTQLGLAVSYGLFRNLLGATPSLEACARAVNRGRRSAVGTYGFFYGGLIVDQGKREGEPVSPLHCRLELPEHWRWVLVRPPAPIGLAGEAEQKAFEGLPAMTKPQVARLRETVFDQLIPSVAIGDHAAFAHSLYDYGRRAGECFAMIQGGPYRNQTLASLVDRMRAWGHAGVGQSSWGPTLFVITRSTEEANGLAERLAREEPETHVTISPSRNAPVECVESLSEGD